MKRIRARYPKAVCLKSRNGWAVYTRRFGNRLSEGKTQKEAWDLAARKIPVDKKPCVEIVQTNGDRRFFDVDEIKTLIVHQKSQAEVLFDHEGLRRGRS